MQVKKIYKIYIIIIAIPVVLFSVVILSIFSIIVNFEEIIGVMKDFYNEQEEVECKD